VKLPKPNDGTVKDVEDSSPKPVVSELKIEPYIYIAHEGEANKIRVMPQSPDGRILATKAGSGEVCLYNYAKHPSKPLGRIGP
jgi:hypothetical protein